MTDDKKLVHFVSPYLPESSPLGEEPIPEEDPMDDIAVGTKKGPPFSGFVVY